MKFIQFNILFLLAINIAAGGQHRQDLRGYSDLNVDSLFDNFKPRYKSITFGIFGADPIGYNNVFFKIDLPNKKLYIDSTRNLKFKLSNFQHISGYDFSRETLSYRMISESLIAMYSLPNEIKTMNSGVNIHGCPDCRDGGGIFIELEYPFTKKQLFAQIFRGDQNPKNVFIVNLWNTLYRFYQLGYR